MTLTRWITALAALAALGLVAVESLPAQSIPPNLRNRALPPSRPFDFGSFTAPGSDRAATGSLSESAVSEAREAVARVAAELDRVVAAGELDRVVAAGELDRVVAAGELDRVVAEAGPGPQWTRVTPDDPWSDASFARSRAAAAELARAVDRMLEDPDALLGAAALWNELVVSAPESLVRDGVTLIRARGALLALLAPDAPPADVRPGDGAPRGALLLPLPVQEVVFPGRWAIPGISASNPHGFGADWGEVWAGGSFQPRVRRLQSPGGALAAGFGMGDAERYAGLQVGLSSFTTRAGLAERGAIDVHLHRRLPGGFSVALGWESARAWGPEEATRDSGSNRYVVASRWFTVREDPNLPFSAVVLTLGAGDGRFQSEEAFTAGESGVGVFGSVAVRVWPPGSLIVEWTGQDLLVGTSITPLRDRRLAITGGFTDMIGTAGDGARFVLGASAAYDFIWR